MHLDKPANDNLTVSVVPEHTVEIITNSGEGAQKCAQIFGQTCAKMGNGVWTVEIREGVCEIRPEFAEGADVRYTASARDWCAVALGVLDAKEAVKSGRLHKEGGPQAMDEFFYQIARPELERAPKREGETP